MSYLKIAAALAILAILAGIALATLAGNVGEPVPCEYADGRTAVETGRPCYWNPSDHGSGYGVPFIAYPDGSIDY